MAGFSGWLGDGGSEADRRRRWALPTAAVILVGVTVEPALADPPPSVWQPVVSNSSGAIGEYDTVTQPVNITGLLALLPTTDIPDPGTGVLSWNASADTLSWRGGPAVAVNPSASASYDLPGTDWSLANTPGFGTGEQMRIRSSFELGGYLYASGENDCDADDYPGCVQRGFELWRLAGPPACDVVATLRPGHNGFTGNLAEQEVGVQAPGELESISDVEIANGVVYWPDFTPGTTSTVIVTAIKTTSVAATSWSFDAVDEWGQTTYCG